MSRLLLINMPASSWVPAVILLWMPVIISPARADSTDTHSHLAAQSPTMKCSVMTDETVDPDLFTDYNGQRVYFCCQMCRQKFLRNPQAYLAQLAQVQPQAPAITAPPTPPGQTTDSGPDAGHPSHAPPPPADNLHSNTTAPSDHRDTAHAHSEHDESTSLTGWLGRWHPLLVHFPIALLVTALFAELLSKGGRRVMFAHAGLFCAAVGGASAVPAAVLGWLAGGWHWVDADWLTTTHRWLGSLTGLAGVLAAVLAVRLARAAEQSPSRAYRLVLLVCLALVGATGFFGASLIYGLDHLAW